MNRRSRFLLLALAADWPWAWPRAVEAITNPFIP